ncbi:MAG: DUF1343 domain-containing protein [Duncaniella sp.]|nr:DUF1343 domain-containing protein [Duncaniella sp.]
MKKSFKSILLLALILCGCGGNTETATASQEVLTSPDTRKTLTGIEVLRENGFDILKGKKIGLITNPTGVDASLVSTIDILADAPGVTLSALFAPEHGVRGDYIAGATVANSVDKKTGVKVYSLHGKTRRPTPEMLRGLDALVYDIQDIGCRSYTFISTMGLAMRAAAEEGIEFIVLDRPNPLGGERVEGCGVDPDCVTFVSQFDIPYIYGLTPGELASYFVGEGIVSKTLRLTVVPLKGWTREMSYDQTGLPWVLPSPHIPQPVSAMFYPATGIMGELDYVNIGVGYTLPFQLATAPWIDGQKLCDALRKANVPGMEWRPVWYKPFYGIFKGEAVSGVQPYIADSNSAVLSLTQFYLMEQLADLYPSHLPFATAAQSRLTMFDKVCGSKKIRQAFSRNYKVADIYALWMGGCEEFKQKSMKYRLYE